MGNALRFLYAQCCKPTTAEDSESLGHHGVSAVTVGVSALAHDLFHFEITSQVFIFLCLNLVLISLLSFTFLTTSEKDSNLDSPGLEELDNVTETLTLC